VAAADRRRLGRAALVVAVEVRAAHRILTLRALSAIGALGALAVLRSLLDLGLQAEPPPPPSSAGHGLFSLTATCRCRCETGRRRAFLLRILPFAAAHALTAGPRDLGALQLQSRLARVLLAARRAHVAGRGAGLIILPTEKARTTAAETEGEQRSEGRAAGRWAAG
jgi:hypothetical protein